MSESSEKRVNDGGDPQHDIAPYRRSETDRLTVTPIGRHAMPFRRYIYRGTGQDTLTPTL